MRRKSTSSTWITAAWVAAAALLVDGLVAWWLPDVRFLKYPEAAELWRAGEISGERLMDFSPLYLGLHRVFLVFPDPGLAVWRLQILLAALAAGLVYVLLARRLTRGLALVGAGVFVLDRTLLTYQNILEPELLLLALLVAMLVLLDRSTPAADEPRDGSGSAESSEPAAADAPRAGRELALPLLAGVCAGLSLATRPTLLPVVLTVPVYLALRPPPGRRRARLRAIVAFVLPVAVALALLGARAARHTGDWRAPMMSPGTVFFEGNHPLSHGTSADYPPLVLGLARQPSGEPDPAHRYYREVARGSTGEALSLAAANAYWSSRARRFLVAEPAAALRRVGSKLEHAFHNGRLHDVASAWYFDLILPPTIPFALLAAVALIGVLAEARRWRQSLLLLALIFAQLAVMLVFYVSARQRLALLPALVFFAMVGIERLRRRPRALLLTLSGLLFVSLILPTDLLRQETYRRERDAERQEAFQDLRERFLREPPSWHADEAAAAIALEPWRHGQLRPAFVGQDDVAFTERVRRALVARGDEGPQARFDLALATLEAGRLDEAEALFHELLETGFVPYRAGMPASVHVHLGHLALRRDDRAAAVEAFEHALGAAPGDPFALAPLWVLTGEPRYRERLLAYWSELDADDLIGRAWLAAGDGERAVPHLERVVSALPELRAAKVALAAALAAAGRLEAGARVYLEAASESVDPVLFDPQIPDLFRAWSAADPRPSVHLATARVLHQYGHLREALTILERLQSGPDLPPPMTRAIRDQITDLHRALDPPPSFP